MKTKEILKLTKELICYQDTVLILRDIDEQTSIGGIIIPDTEKAPKSTGIVLGKGKKCLGEYKVGDRVKFNCYADTTVEYKGVYFLIMRDCDVLFGIPGDSIDLSHGVNRKKKRIDIPRPDFSQLKD